jgi:hypothetical protein
MGRFDRKHKAVQDHPGSESTNLAASGDQVAAENGRIGDEEISPRVIANPARETAKFIGWLTGSIAGIGAILYAVGYITTQTHLSLLGVDSFLQYGNDFYLRKGGNFFIVLAIYSVRFAFTVFNLLLYYLKGSWRLCLIVVVVFSIGAYFMRHSFLRVLALSRRTLLDFPWIWRPFLPALVLIVTIGVLVGNMDKASAPLRVTGLLFAPSAASPGSVESADLRAALVDHDDKVLHGCFTYVYVRFVLGILVLVAVRAITVNWRARHLVLLPFWLILLYYGFLLPAVFGVVMREAQFHPVRIVTEKTDTVQRNGDFFLLQANEQGFTLWDRGRSRVLWLRKDTTESIEVEGLQDIFRNSRNR